MCLLDLHDSPQFHCVASFSKRASSSRSLKRARALETCVYIALDLYSAEVILRYWRAAPFAVAPTLCRDAISAWRSSEMEIKISYDTWDRRIWKFSFRSLHPERCFCFGFLNVNETIILICHPHRSGGKTARISVASVAWFSTWNPMRKTRSRDFVDVSLFIRRDCCVDDATVHRYFENFN